MKIRKLDRLTVIEVHRHIAALIDCGSWRLAFSRLTRLTAASARKKCQHVIAIDRTYSCFLDQQFHIIGLLSQSD